MTISDNLALFAQLPRHICLVAVSKTKPVGMIQKAYDSGQRHFGENYVQEMIAKVSKLPRDIKWHFIGNLQSNKVNSLIAKVPNLHLVESVNSIKLATVLNAACIKFGRDEQLHVLVEVSTSDETTKSGIGIDLVDQLVDHIRIKCPALRIRGFMTIADPVNPRASFKLLSELRLATCQRLGISMGSILDGEFTLSMGMTSDWEDAIRFGSTEVRIGSGIFGARSGSSVLTNLGKF